MNEGNFKGLKNKMLKKIWLWIAGCFRIHEEKALHKNKSFWFAIFFPMFWIGLIFLALTMELQNKGLFNPRITSDALNGFVKFYAFPITLLTLPLTFAVMVNRFHSSKQKAKSNELVERNNESNNYFNHYKYFAEHCESVTKRFGNEKLNVKPEFLYKILFPDSSIQSFNATVPPYIVDDILKVFDLNIDKLRTHLDLYETERVKNEYDENGVLVSNGLDYLKKEFKYCFEIDGLKHQAHISLEKKMYSSMKTTLEVLVMLLSFHGIANYKEVTDNLSNRFHVLVMRRFDIQRENIVS